MVEVKLEKATAIGNKMAWLVKSSGIEFGGKIFTLPRNSYSQFEISQYASGYVTEDYARFDEKVSFLRNYIRNLTNNQANFKIEFNVI
jgi:hypothetical protein